MKRKGWTDVQRRKQAAYCKSTQPWTASTGPKTNVGKSRSSLNAAKHGMRSAEILRLLSLLAAHNRYLDSLYNIEVKGYSQTS